MNVASSKLFVGANRAKEPELMNNIPDDMVDGR